MAENETPKREIVYHAPTREFDNKTHLVTNVGFTAKTDERFQIVWLIPATDEEAKERYDCTIQDLVASGIRQLSTRPDYKTVGFNEDGTLKEGGHAAMQALADGYKVGQRAAAGPSIKAKAAELDAQTAAAKEAGFESISDMIAFYKSGGKKGKK